MVKKLSISSLIEQEVNEICELYVLNKQKRIRIIHIFNCLKFKDPITYKYTSYLNVKYVFIKLFPLYKNKRKNTKYFKISKKQVSLNKRNSEFTLKPTKDLRLETYGIDKKNFYKKT